MGKSQHLTSFEFIFRSWIFFSCREDDKKEKKALPLQSGGEKELMNSENKMGDKNKKKK